ncbi:hypothetical protein JOF36_002599 [Pseudonocardia parietis]|uniref:ABC transporter domain-containing protein n=1 Tax=Pseudonocardia parietis TaxID=570936 RepID=A0ABS4VSI7_9PSEU|nr:hypothetical protein [Pseudonocardia parietis]
MVLDRVSLTVHPGERIGVIGDNGSGKSTLLKLMAGVEHPDNGELVVVAPGGVGYLPQSLALPSHATVADAVDLALADLRELEDRMRVAERALGAAGVPERVDLDAYAALVAEFEARGVTRPTSGWTSRCTGSACPGSTGAARWARSPEVNAPGSPWPPCWRRIPSCCCSTNRPTTWTTRRRPGSSSACAPTGARS